MMRGFSPARGAEPSESGSAAVRLLMSAWGVFCFPQNMIASPLPAAKETPSREIIRSSARGFRIISQLFRAGLFDRPSGAPHLLFSGEYRPRRGNFPVLHENRVTAARPSPRRERNSGAGNCPLIRARLSNHLTASCAGLFDRPSGAPHLLFSGDEYIQCRGNLPLHAGAARIFAFCRAWTRAFCRETLAFPTLIWYINGVFMK